MPSSQQVHLAVDLGASGGRVLAGRFSGRRLALDEVYRFTNGPITANGTMFWDVLRLWEDVQTGLMAAGEGYGASVASVGADTWGVDYALLGRNDELLANPVHYRDKRTVGMMEAAFDVMPRREIFDATGLQFMELNTLYQLFAQRRAESVTLEMAERLLLMPDIFHWLLSGEKANERTHASTTQCYSPMTGGWCTELLERFDIPTKIFGDIVDPGATLGPLQRGVAEATGLAGVSVVVPGAHDTASAVMAAPTLKPVTDKPNWVYISSGTWSLMGAEVPQPIVNDDCVRFNFTNEGGVGGTIRLLKNIAGLWLIQECRRMWSLAGKDYTWEQLVLLAEKAPPLVSLVNPDAAIFTAPKDMPGAIAEYCKITTQPGPESEGAFVRCCLESLALRYRSVLNMVETLTGSTIETIHIMGGGVQNTALCQMAADACRRRVVAGPVEATAIGNLMMQVIASGEVANIAEARQIIRNSFPVQEYTPDNPEPYDEAYERFERLIAS